MYHIPPWHTHATLLWFPCPMNNDSRLLFHLTQGALRRWSLYSEATFPEDIAGLDEFEKWAMFQDWKNNPSRVIGANPDGSQKLQYHPMCDFENWPYRIILDLLRTINAPQDIYDQFQEPENMKQLICDYCDALYSDFEQQPISNLRG